MTAKTPNNKGYFFTVAITLLIIPFLLLVTFSATQDRSTVDDAAGKIRCDELQYFVEDVKRDLDRAMGVFGRRATIYAIDHVVSNNDPLDDYVFQNCTSYVYHETGATAAIAELILCATLDGANVSAMQNHTMPLWIDKMTSQGVDMNFQANITLQNITITPYDAFSFAIIVNNSVDVFDESDMCFYQGTSVETVAYTSLIGLEDPLYPLYTNGLMTSAIQNCTAPYVEFPGMAGCTPDDGSGLGGGEALIYSTQLGSPAALESYCNLTDHDILSKKVLVMDSTFASNCTTAMQSCLLRNETDTFAALVDYDGAPDGLATKCAATIPWINATGDLAPPTPTGADATCGANTSLAVEEQSCLYLKNQGTNHYLYLGIGPREVNTSCYQTSNISTYGTYCPHQYGNGPSFFDRMEGRLNLSDKYVDQSLAHFNRTDIGLESLINPYDFLARGVTVKPTATWIDYLYWQNVSACEVYGVCQGTHTYAFRLDCPHAERDGLTSACFSSFNQPPASDILSPADGTTFDTCPHDTLIEGNASDEDGNITLVEVSWDGGLTWHTANGAETWNITWDPGVDGTYTLYSRATDNNGTLETPHTPVQVTMDGCGGCPLGWVTIYNGTWDNDYISGKTAGDDWDDEGGAKVDFDVDETGNITLWSWAYEIQDQIGVQETEEETAYLEFNLLPNDCFRHVNFTWSAKNNISCKEEFVCGNWEANIIVTHNGTDTETTFIGNHNGATNCPAQAGTCPAEELDPIDEGNTGFDSIDTPGNDTIQKIRFEAWSWISTQLQVNAEGSSDTTVYLHSIQVSP